MERIGQTAGNSTIGGALKHCQASGLFPLHSQKTSGGGVQTNSLSYKISGVRMHQNYDLKLTACYIIFEAKMLRHYRLTRHQRST